MDKMFYTMDKNTMCFLYAMPTNQMGDASKHLPFVGIGIGIYSAVFLI